jgi:hypothetical protein
MYAAYENWLILALSIVLAIVAWISFAMRTYCDVQNRTDGRPCGNTVYGRLRACRLHKRQKRDALWALFGLINPAQRWRITWAREDSPHAYVTPSPTNTRSQVINPLYEQVLLITAVVSCVFTVLAVVVQVA